MDDFGDLTTKYGLKPKGKSVPMASSKNEKVNQNDNYNPQAQNSTSFNKNNHTQNYDFDDFLGGFQKKSSNNGNGYSNFDAFSTGGDDLFGGFNGSHSYSFNHNNNNSIDDDDDIFGIHKSSNSNQSAYNSNKNAGVGDLLGGFSESSQKESLSVDDLISSFDNAATSSSNKGDSLGMNKSAFTSTDDPFSIFESTPTTTKTASTDPLEEFGSFTYSGSTKSAASSNVSSSLKPPPKPGQVLKSDKVKSSSASFIDDLENFGKVKVQNIAREKQSSKASKYKEAEDGAWNNQQSTVDIESFFGMSHRSSSAPKSRTTTSDPLFDASTTGRREPSVASKKSTSASSGMRKASSATSIVDDFPSMFGDLSFSGGFEEVEGESDERRKARYNRYLRTQDRMAQAVADMTQRDLQTQYEQEERGRLADRMDYNIKQWANGKDGNMRALLSSLQDVLWPECGWEPVSLVDLIASAAVKKVYRKATLCVHPDKVQQKGATLEQKYTAEKVFDILKDCWKKFEKEELR